VFFELSFLPPKTIKATKLEGDLPVGLWAIGYGEWEEKDLGVVQLISWKPEA